jgi:hypothetical protein
MDSREMIGQTPPRQSRQRTGKLKSGKAAHPYPNSLGKNDRDGDETQLDSYEHTERQWRTLGTVTVPDSMPLSNLIAEVHDILSPQPQLLSRDYLGGPRPRYLAISSGISVEGAEYLEKKGAFTIPNDDLRNELLRSYVLWVHNYVPFLELHDFLECVARADGTNRISLLLFQAVMFAASTFVDLEHLQAAGYATRKTARKALLQKVRVSGYE